MNDEFYITLLSNSSMKYFPDNKTSSFRTQLSRTIKLDGIWEIALAEIQYPCTINNINTNNNSIFIKNVNGVKQVVLEENDYDNLESLLSALNYMDEFKYKIVFLINEATKRVNVHFVNEESTTIEKLSLAPALCQQLGFEPETDLFKQREARHSPNLVLGLPSFMFVYCDLIEPQIVGDVDTKLLRTVGINKTIYTYGSQQTVTFTNPHYVRVLIREFENIEIDIRADQGLPIPFVFGTLCIKLHFRKVRTE